MSSSKPVVMLRGSGGAKLTMGDIVYMQESSMESGRTAVHAGILFLESSAPGESLLQGVCGQRRVVFVGLGLDVDVDVRVVDVQEDLVPVERRADGLLNADVGTAEDEGQAADRRRRRPESRRGNHRLLYPRLIRCVVHLHANPNDRSRSVY